MPVIAFVHRRTLELMKTGQVIGINDKNPRDTPLYNLVTAAAIVGVPRGTLRYWVKAAPDKRAIVEIPDPSATILSFANLVEAHILFSTLARDIPLARVRRAVESLRREFPSSKHPLLEQKFYTVDGCRDLFIKEAAGRIVNASRDGQVALRQILERHLKRIEHDRTGPVRFFPMRSERIVVDLNVSSARPVVRGTGVMASIIASRHLAGDSVRELASDYKLKTADVEAAIKFITAA